MNAHDAESDDITSQLEFAWRAHSAQEAWTAKVDVKASVLLAAQVGLLVAIAALATTDGYRSSDGFPGLLVPAGVLAILAAGVASAAAVYPLLASAEATRKDLIYFGHLRHLNAQEIDQRLEELSPCDQLSAIANQLASMARSNWRKHRRLQFSIWLTGVGSVLAVVGIIASY